MNAGTQLVHPVFAQSVLAASRRPMRLGPISAGSDGRFARAEEDGLAIEVMVGPSSHEIVEEARHSGAGNSLVSGILDLFCQTIEGLPLREAADHGTIHVLERLRGELAERAVPGILTPRNAGAAFGLCERLIRRILAEQGPSAKSRAGKNFWNPALSAAWRKQSNEQRLSTLAPVVESFRSARGLAAEDFYLTVIEKAHRVIVGFGPNVSVQRKPPLLRQFERELRMATGDRLEVYMQEMKDDNAIRRLAPGGTS